MIASVSGEAWCHDLSISIGGRLSQACEQAVLSGHPHFGLSADILFSIIIWMSKTDKTLARMRANPRDWRIEQLQALARARSIQWRQQGTSHVVFVRSDGRTLPVPARRPIKPVYIRLFLQFLED